MREITMDIDQTDKLIPKLNIQFDHQMNNDLGTPECRAFSKPTWVIGYTEPERRLRRSTSFKKYSSVIVKAHNVRTITRLQPEIWVRSLCIIIRPRPQWITR